MAKAPFSDDYIRFDEISDVLASVDLVALLAPLVHEKPHYWKWIVISAHSALQGAMVCALVDSTGTSILEDGSAKKVLAWHNSDEAAQGPYPEERLASFGELLDRCIAGGPNFEPLKLTPGQREDVKRLHDHFRNNFVHFTPKGWSIEKAGLPRIVEAALDAAEELMSRPQVTRSMGEGRLERLNKALRTARLSLQN